MKKCLSIALIFLFLSACSQTPDLTLKNEPWEDHIEKIEKIENWTLSGKLAIISPKERHSLNIFWEQKGDNAHLILTTFLGTTVLDVKKNNKITQITDHNNKRYFSNDSKSLIKQLLGMDLPIKQLQQWIKGNPTQASFELNSDNLLLSLQEKTKASPWIASYKSYRTIKNINLPYRIQLKRNNLRLKFAISKWTINE
jgi:outer membrane lipoprotein LolB